MATSYTPTIYKNYIGGEWSESRGGKVIEDHNPANTEELVGVFPASTAADVAAAVDAAKSALDKWRLTPAPKRAEILFRTAEILVERKEDYATQMTREMGKVLAETRGDVQEAIDMTYLMAGEGRRMFGQTTPSELPNKFAMSERVPVGVVGLITPWNFPMAIPSWKAMPALVCGNTLVLKPAEDTPLSTYNLVQALEEAGLPPGVLNLVFGKGPGAGAPMLTSIVTSHQFYRFDEVPRLVSQAVAPTFKKLHLEMGGKNIIVVMDDANLDLAVEGAVWGGFGTTGQRCTAASRVAVHQKVYREFSEKFVDRVKKLHVGDGLQATTDMGPLVNEAQLQTTMRYVKIGVDEGAKMACGGHRLDKGALAKGWFHEPTVFVDCDPNMRICQEEIFGPVVSLIRPFNTLDEAISIANGVKYGLSASIYTRNVNSAMRARRDLETGIVYVNAPTIGAETHLPFGGTKNTGNGHREAGLAALDFYSDWKTVYIDYSDKLQRAQIDNTPG